MDNLKNRQTLDTGKIVNNILVPNKKSQKQIGADLSDIYHLNAPLVHMQFDLKDYENRQFENKVQLASFGLIIALIVIFFKFKHLVAPKKVKVPKTDQQNTGPEIVTNSEE